MYEIVKPAYTVNGVDGPYEVPEERRTFHTAAGLLRWALKARLLEHGIGGRPYPTRFDDKWLGRDGERYADYGLIDSFCRWKFTAEHKSAMRRAQQRYVEIIHYLREVEPEWRPDTRSSATGEVHYADNSIERHEVNKYGQRRRIMVLAPSGDACF